MSGRYAAEGKSDVALLAFSVQRIARALSGVRGVDQELLRVADADAMIVLQLAGIDLPPSLRKVAEDRIAERRRGERAGALPRARSGGASGGRRLRAVKKSRD